MNPETKQRQEANTMAVVDKQRLRAAVKNSNPKADSRHPKIRVDQEGLFEVLGLEQIESKQRPGELRTHVALKVIESTSDELKPGSTVGWSNKDSDPRYGMDRVVRLVLVANGIDAEEFDMPEEGSEDEKIFDKMIEEAYEGGINGAKVKLTTTMITTNSNFPFCLGTFDLAE